MSYGKKDEDADLGLVKVDRTQVFQEGTSCYYGPVTAPDPRDGLQGAQLTGPPQHDFSTAPRSNREDVEFS